MAKIGTSGNFRPALLGLVDRYARGVGRQGGGVGHGSRELGVRYVLEGSVRTAGGHIRITGQLIDAETGKHIWAEKYDRELRDLFAVQDDITERVVAAVEPHLYAQEGYRAASKPPDSIDAWGLVVRALGQISKVERKQNEEAQSLLRRAVVTEPSYARAHALLGWAVWWAAYCYWNPDTREGYRRAAGHANDALSLDPTDPWARIYPGIIGFASRRLQRRALLRRLGERRRRRRPVLREQLGLAGLGRLEVRFLDVAVAADVLGNRGERHGDAVVVRRQGRDDLLDQCEIIDDELALHAALGRVAEDVERACRAGPSVRARNAERRHHPRPELALLEMAGLRIALGDQRRRQVEFERVVAVELAADAR